MKVLLAHKFFRVTGGAEVFFFETGRVLEENGHAVAYFSTTASDNVSSNYSEYFVSPPEYHKGTIIKRALGIGRIIYSIEAKKKITSLIKKFKPDLVHVFAFHVHLTPSILVAAYEAGIPVLMSCNDYKHICPNYKLYHHHRICKNCYGGRFYMATVNRCCKNSLIFSAASSLEAYAHNTIGVYKKYIHTYLFASDFMARQTESFWGTGTFRWDKLKNPFESQKYKLSDSYNNFSLYFGRLTEEKGVDILIRSAKLVPEVKIKIVGDGPIKQELQALTKKLGVNNVEFLGAIWGDELHSILAQSRFVVVPSVWHENFPYVINQSFAFGKPVIGSDRGGIPELVSHGQRGLIYPAEDVKMLSLAMSELWNDPERAVRMGRTAKEYVDAEFNDQRFYEKLMTIYKGVLDESTGAGR
jgi:glycosyltransferase involved in cell wall biosynthesis